MFLGSSAYGVCAGSSFFDSLVPGSKGSFNKRRLRSITAAWPDGWFRLDSGHQNVKRGSQLRAPSGNPRSQIQQRNADTYHRVDTMQATC